MALLLNKLRGNGIYLLDEPEAALSPSRQMAALRAIHQLVQASSQFVIATHSPILLAYPGAYWISATTSSTTTATVSNDCWVTRKKPSAAGA